MTRKHLRRSSLLCGSFGTESPCTFTSFLCIPKGVRRARFTISTDLDKFSWPDILVVIFCAAFLLKGYIMNYIHYLLRTVFTGALLGSLSLVGSEPKSLTLGRHRGAQVQTAQPQELVRSTSADELVRQLLAPEQTEEDEVMNSSTQLKSEVETTGGKLSFSQRIKLSRAKKKGSAGQSRSPRGSGSKSPREDKKSPRSPRMKSPRAEKSPRIEPKKSPRSMRRKKKIPANFFTHACGGLRTVAAVEGQAAMCNKGTDQILAMYNTDWATIEEIERRDAELVKLLQKFVDENGWNVERKRYNGKRQWVITTEATSMSAKEFRENFGEEDPIPGCRAVAVRTYKRGEMGDESEYDILLALSEEVSQLDQKTFKNVFGAWRTEQEQFHFTTKCQKNLKDVHMAIMDLCSEESIRATVKTSAKTAKAVTWFANWYARKRVNPLQNGPSAKRWKNDRYRQEVAPDTNFKMLEALYDDEDVSIVPSAKNSSDSSEDAGMLIIEQKLPQHDVVSRVPNKPLPAIPLSALPLSKRRTLYLADPEESSCFPDDMIDSFAKELQHSIAGYAKEESAESGADESSSEDVLPKGSGHQMVDMTFGDSEDSEKENQMLSQLNQIFSKRCNEVRRRTSKFDYSCNEDTINEETGEVLYVFGGPEESEMYAPVRRRGTVALSGIFSPQRNAVQNTEVVDLSEFISYEESCEDGDLFGQQVTQVLPELAKLSPEEFAQEYAEFELEKKEQEIEHVSRQVYGLLRQVHEFEESMQESSFVDVTDESEAGLVLEMIDQTFLGKISQFREKIKTALVKPEKQQELPSWY